MGRAENGVSSRKSVQRRKTWARIMKRGAGERDCKNGRVININANITLRLNPPAKDRAGNDDTRQL